MNLTFYKYQGTGNDFIIVDNCNEKYSGLTDKQIELLCDRRFGIGADGFIAIERSEEYDFRMRYYNSDGLEASMCGNGGRCAVAFANSLGIIGKETVFVASDGPHKAVISYENYIDLKMANVDGITEIKEGLFLNTGSPHYVRFCENVNEIQVKKEGFRIRSNSELFPEGTNVNFVEKKLDNEIFVRTYERGVEDETLSCGTGVVASAICSVIEYQENNLVNIKTMGGELKVRFKAIKDFNNCFFFDDIWLSGNAGFVFSGNIVIES